MSDFSALTRFAGAKGAEPKGARRVKEWTPPVPEDFEPGEVLAFDQSLANTGWVHLVFGLNGVFRVVDAGSFGTDETKARGVTQTLLRAEEHHGIVFSLMAQKFPAATANQSSLKVAYETPPVGGRMSRPESSLTSAVAIRIAARQYGCSAIQVGSQSAKKMICGNGNAEKKDAHAALSRVAGSGFITGYGAITNEAKRDALLVGMTALRRL